MGGGEGVKMEMEGGGVYLQLTQLHKTRTIYFN